MRHKAYSRGHTLVEVVVVLAIAFLAVGLALSDLQQMASNMHLRSSMHAFMSGLRLTRAEAIRRNGRVVMCKSGDGMQCAQHGDWSQGWIIFVDSNGSGGLEAGESVLYREPPLHEAVLVSGNALVGDFISYAGTGRALQLNGGFQAGTLTMCLRGSHDSGVYQVILGKPGLPRAQKVNKKVCA